ncbi:MAG: DotA/TraY family protein [Alphaproteobacteria bacterium]|nr:DotA/TraY family protein [Alphaproteobacteria bacterium]
MSDGITHKDVLKYSFLPGLKGRFKDLFGTGFQYIPYFIALVYGAVRLLPANHPYLSPQNMGRYGIRHVVAEAANNIVMSRQNIDQVILFFAVMVGLILIVIQLGFLGMAVFIQPAVAAMPTNFGGFFVTAAPQQDLAFIMLDMVFGVPGMFDSCISTGAACVDMRGDPITRAPGSPAPPDAWAYEPAAFPLPVHDGLHTLFLTYNTALTVVAVLISIYFITTIIMETAQSGTAFGKRFNKVWAPVRFVVAFGLVFPITYGYSSSQYIVLYAANYGSSFATNGWLIFNDVLNTSYGAGFSNLLNDGDTTGQSLVGAPNIPEVGTLLQFLFVAKSCAEGYAFAGPEKAPLPQLPVQMYLVRDSMAAPPNLEVANFGAVDYNQLINFADGEGKVVIRFGKRDPDSVQGDGGAAVNVERFPTEKGFVEPTCGELTMDLTDPRPAGDAEDGLRIMQEYYWFIIREVWFDVMDGVAAAALPTNAPYPQNFVCVYTDFAASPSTGTGDEETVALTGATACNPPDLPESEYRSQLQDFYSADIREVLTGTVSTPPGSTGIVGIVGGTPAVDAMAASGRWAIDADLRQKGWAGAAIWYNRIAEMNGGLTNAVLSIPQPTKYPKLMEKVYAEKRQGEQNVNFARRFDPSSNTGTATEGLSEKEKKLANALWMAFNFWQEGGGVASTHTAETGNAAVDILNTLFGTEGLFSIRRNADTHPLAQLTGVGRSLVEASIRNLVAGVTVGAGGAIPAIFDKTIGSAKQVVSSVLFTAAMVGLTAGFILFYVVPFMPFIYFFFAVGGWIKGIFEAMVGVPLWALAHLRIDGNGLPGQAAVAGYFLVFEVFLRPILIIFGMLASISIFSALVSVLHQVFDLVVANTGGFDSTLEIAGPAGTLPKVNAWRSAVDEFFFTVIYTIIVYLMGLSSFKLVDLIPNNILRWMGQSVATFGDQREDSGQSLVSTSTVGAQQTLGSLDRGLKSIAGAGN